MHANDPYGGEMIFSDNCDGGFIKLEDGRLIHLSEMRDKIPHVFLHVGDKYRDICSQVADQYYPYPKGSAEYEILINFLAQRSAKIKNIAAIILISRKRKIIEICYDYIDEKFQSFFDYPIIFSGKKQKNDDISFLDRSQKINALIKYFPNKLFYILRKRKMKKTSSVIRSWVDVDEKLHIDHFSDSAIYIYPFGINLYRSYKFIKYCMKKYENVSLMGVPYSFYDVLKLFMCKGIKQDMRLIEYEMSAMVRHRKEFEAYDEIYTSDEYIPAINALYSDFINRKKIVNNNHGVGYYNQYIKYTEMITYNEAQRIYYTKYNPNVAYNVKNTDFYYKPFEKGKKVVVIFVDQNNLKIFSLLYENALQQAAFEKLKTVCTHMGLEFAIKFHPNRLISDQQEIMAENPDLIQLSSFGDDCNYIFFSLYSTAFYDFRHYGKFCFIKDDFFDPRSYFGDEIKPIFLDDIQNVLNDYINS